jgi:hypothetical protein
MDAAAPAIPPKPRTPATMATTRKNNAQLNISTLLLA